jgi:hypothetical protein
MGEIKKGDRVKVTAEGVVEHLYSDGSVLLEGWDVSIGGGDDPEGYATGPITIEKLPDPLPTTPGSHIRRPGRTRGYVYRTLGEDGRWHMPGETFGIRTDHLDDGYEVVHDAGKDS